MKTFPALLLTSLLVAHPALAQRPGDNLSPLPLQGQPLPEVSAVDAEGNPVDLRQQLKGRHGVIVFGCLT